MPRMNPIIVSTPEETRVRQLVKERFLRLAEEHRERQAEKAYLPAGPRMAD